MRVCRMRFTRLARFSTALVLHHLLWSTVCQELVHEALRHVCSRLVASATLERRLPLTRTSALKLPVYEALSY
jgi:hypothetical protein